MSNFVTRRLKKLTLKATYARFFDTLKYALYVIVHPADGFWDLIHAKRGFYTNLAFKIYKLCCNERSLGNCKCF